QLGQPQPVAAVGRVDHHVHELGGERVVLVEGEVFEIGGGRALGDFRLGGEIGFPAHGSLLWFAACLSSRKVSFDLVRSGRHYLNGRGACIVSTASRLKARHAMLRQRLFVGLASQSGARGATISGGFSAGNARATADPYQRGQATFSALVGLCTRAFALA